MPYGKHFNLRQTPQDQPIPGSGQVKNSAGGYAWQISPWERLTRFLILGTEGGTYYASERALTIENAENVWACLNLDPKRVVDETIAVSDAGRAPKNSPALFVMAMACSEVFVSDQVLREYALDRLEQVARTPTHLFEFLGYVLGFRKWGRGLRNAVARWYNGHTPENLVYHLVKYRQRAGWTHRDVLRVVHPTPVSEAHSTLYNWAIRGEADIDKLGDQALLVLEGYHRAQAATTPERWVEIIKAYNLPREALPTQALSHPQVWAALLETGMPVMALTRNLANLGRNGVIGPGLWDTNQLVVSALSNDEVIRRSRMHPIHFLLALRIYTRGYNNRGRWVPEPSIRDALEGAYYKAFGNIDPTGKRIVIGLDVSGSMDYMTIPGLEAFTARDGAVAMAMATVRTEPYTAVYAFGSRLQKLGIGKNDRLSTVLKKTKMNFGGTDAALPILQALQDRTQVDAFITYTDNETWAGAVHPAQALQRYREEMGIPAKLIVVGMTSTGFSIADPNDAGMLDVVGFDANTPQAISEFIRL